MPIVEINNLTKDYEVGFWRKRKVRVLDGLSVNVEQGEIFGFLGANGAGKTTTLKLLMRLIFPTAGSARILGRDIADVRMHQQIGYLPENPYFYDYLTAREFLEYCGELFGLDKSTRAAKAKDLLYRVHLDEKRWDTQLRKFSKGMLQRVGLAQAIVNDPEIVFLDEPMSGLDPIGRREVRDLISELRHEGRTVFMCSHILSDIEVLCDRVAILKKGKLAHQGLLHELAQEVEGKGAVEMVVTSTDTAAFLAHHPDPSSIVITATAAGLRIQIEDESDVDEVLASLRKAGGRLISIQPVRQSLEALFISDSKTSEPS
jgi:ABC-2 type transport system ATP-binding protein